MILPKYINVPAAWKGVDMRQNPGRWIYSLAIDEIAELKKAADDFLFSGGDIGSLKISDFPLPTLGLKLKNLQETLTKRIGFQLIKGLPIDQYGIETTAAIFCGIGSHLGFARSQNAKGHILGHVKDLGIKLDDPNTRIYQTTERQSFHTDSCDVVGLLCLIEAKEGGLSLLASTVTIYNEIQKHRPDLINYLFDPVSTDRRGEVPEGQKPYFNIPILNWYEDLLTGIYQRTYIQSASRFPDSIQLSKEHLEAIDLFDEIANEPDIHLSMQLKPGDMQFVYNHSLLHDRTGFTDWPEVENRRHLLRLWLAMPGDRELPEVFKQRYGSIEIANRGGIITHNTRLHVSLTP